MFRDDLAQQLCRACYGTADHCTKRPQAMALCARFSIRSHSCAYDVSGSGRRPHRNVLTGRGRRL